MVSRRGFLGALVAIPAAALAASYAPSLAESVGSVNTAWNGAVSITADSFTKGDVFTIEGLYEINPRTYEPTNKLRRFVVTQSVTGDGVVNIRPYGT